MPDWPLLDRTPETVNGWLLMRITWPTGFTSDPNSWSRTTLPSTATFAAVATSIGVKKAPCCVGHERINGRSMSVPCTCVPQFWLPATSWPRVFTPAALYCTPCTLRMAFASSGVSVLALPWPCRTPPCVKLPALTMIMFVPADWIWLSIEVCAPVPRATMVITAATPMIIPSMVSAVRILFRLSAFTAIRRIITKDMNAPVPSSVRSRRRFCRRRQRREFFLGCAPPGHGAIGNRLSVTECHDSGAVLRDVDLVCDEYDGDSALAIQALENPHDFDAGFRVEVPGRLVGQQDRRVVDQRARDGDALLLSARELVRMMVGAVAQADEFEHLLRTLVPLGRLHRVAAVEERQLDVVERRRPRQQVENLEHEPDLLVAHGCQRVLRHPGHVLA